MMAFRKMFNIRPNTAAASSSSSTLAIIFILNHFFGYCTPQLYEGSECELKDGSLAVCKSFVLCQWAIQGLNQRVLSYSDINRCSFEGANEIICCADERPTPRPDKNTFPIDTSEDGIYFDDGKLSLINYHSPQSTSTVHNLFSRPINNNIENPLTTTHRSVRISTTQRAQVTATTKRVTSSSTLRITTTFRPLITSNTKRITATSTQRPQTTRSAIQVTTVATISVGPSSRSVTKPTINSFWSQWSPTNDVEMLPIPTTKPTAESSQLNMAPWLQDILNEAIASNNVSTTTPRRFDSLREFNFGDGTNSIDSQSNGESNNDLSFSRPKTTEPSNVTPGPGTTPSRPPTRLGQRRSEIACENYTSLSSPFINQNILGGVPTSLGEFPHMAALGFPSQEFGRFEFDFNCGGSVISENYILTAAHCVTDRNLPTVVKTGKITLLTNDDGVPGVTSTIAEIITHPDYRPSRRYDDIALIRVSSPIPFGDNIRPACLRSNISDVEPNVQLIVTGWGRTSIEKAERSNALLKTNLTGVALESCNASLLGYNANDRSLRNGVNLGQICAYDPDARQDSCEGDSGGPLQIYSPNGMSTIVGVTSFGISCGSALPSVYARVAFYLDWIESIVWPNR
ncbi:serine protease Hayan-like isoform X2 [Bradysia coprophila]|uniref:serine protease Hayan-like isoform X2 n=1 Tax=Bradysia coprophila TaxID=38358 RepID=UPI00187D894C|nr:serine protease Hayan-like isoform X2 [Bradysia coprophila]